SFRWYECFQKVCLQCQTCQNFLGVRARRAAEVANLGAAAKACRLADLTDNTSCSGLALHDHPSCTVVWIIQSFSHLIDGCELGSRSAKYLEPLVPVLRDKDLLKRRANGGPLLHPILQRDEIRSADGLAETLPEPGLHIRGADEKPVARLPKTCVRAP